MSNPEDKDPYFQGKTAEELHNILQALLQHKKLLMSLKKQRDLVNTLEHRPDIVLNLLQYVEITQTQGNEVMSDTLNRLMNRTGIPFSRKNYLEITGLTEPLSAVVEMQIPKGLK